jgi:hypothetical protein
MAHCNDYLKFATERGRIELYDDVWLHTREDLMAKEIDTDIYGQFRGLLLESSPWWLVWYEVEGAVEPVHNYEELCEIMEWYEEDTGYKVKDNLRYMAG